MPNTHPNWKPERRCNVCKKCMTDEKLFRRIMESKQFVKGGETLQAIWEDYKDDFLYLSLYRHAKMHQAPTAGDLAVRRATKLKQEAQVRHFEEAVSTGQARQAAINRLFEKLQNGDFDEDMSVKDLLTALRDSDNAAAKAKDQEIDILKMMMPHRSGEVVETGEVIDGEYEEFDPWEKEPAV